MWNTVTGGASISADVGREGTRPELFAAVVEVRAGALTTAAALAVVLSIAVLAALPVATAFGFAGGLAGPLVAWLGGLAAALGGGKLAVAAWGLATRVLGHPRRPPIAASID